MPLNGRPLARDAEGTLVVTQRGTGVEEGRPMTVTEEWRFSRVRDATMTWKQHTPNRIAVEFRKDAQDPAGSSSLTAFSELLACVGGRAAWLDLAEKLEGKGTGVRQLAAEPREA